MMDDVTVNARIQLLQQCGRVLASDAAPGGRVGWLIYLLESVGWALEDVAEYERMLGLLRQEIDDRLRVGRW